MIKQAFRQISRYNFSKKIITQESYIETQNTSQRTLNELDIKKYRRLNYKRELETNAVPLSPVVGPITIENPQVGTKQYRYCTCGLSQKQPFCDSSHLGTSFKPIKFTLEEATKELNLCGCKLTQNAPFCDQKTCLSILKDQK